MAFTTITSIRNYHASAAYRVRNQERPETTGGKDGYLEIGPGRVVPCNFAVPWCTSEDEFSNGNHYILIAPSVGSGTFPVMFAIWQRDVRREGDYVRYSRDGGFAEPGALVPGNAAVGRLAAIEITGRTVNDADLRFV
jgi:hypothetical protein